MILPVFGLKIPPAGLEACLQARLDIKSTSIIAAAEIACPL
jgi:hypothetical protein